jgi:hypothetical protein
MPSANKPKGPSKKELAAAAHAAATAKKAAAKAGAVVIKNTRTVNQKRNNAAARMKAANKATRKAHKQLNMAASNRKYGIMSANQRQNRMAHALERA